MESEPGTRPVQSHNGRRLHNLSGQPGLIQDCAPCKKRFSLCLCPSFLFVLIISHPAPCTSKRKLISPSRVPSYVLAGVGRLMLNQPEAFSSQG